MKSKTAEKDASGASGAVAAASASSAAEEKTKSKDGKAAEQPTGDALGISAEEAKSAKSKDSRKKAHKPPPKRVASPKGKKGKDGGSKDSHKPSAASLPRIPKKKPAASGDASTPENVPNLRRGRSSTAAFLEMTEAASVKKDNDKSAPSNSVRHINFHSYPRLAFASAFIAFLCIADE